MVHSEQIEIQTKGFTDIINITTQLEEVVKRSSLTNGIVTVFCTGSTAGITIIEFEPGVISDLKRTIENLVPSNASYEHNKRWGDGNGFSHVRAALMNPSLAIPLKDGALVLGTWQQVVLIDFDNRPRLRNLIVQIVGD